MREELWPEIEKRMDMKKFGGYLKRYGKPFAKRALAEVRKRRRKSKRGPGFTDRMAHS
jgi:hypothetical protein